MDAQALIYEYGVLDASFPFAITLHFTYFKKVFREIL